METAPQRQKKKKRRRKRKSWQQETGDGLSVLSRVVSE